MQFSQTHLYADLLKTSTNESLVKLFGNCNLSSDAICSFKVEKGKYNKSLLDSESHTGIIIDKPEHVTIFENLIREECTPVGYFILNMTERQTPTFDFDFTANHSAYWSMASDHAKLCIVRSCKEILQTCFNVPTMDIVCKIRQRQGVGPRQGLHISFPQFFYRRSDMEKNYDLFLRTLSKAIHREDVTAKFIEHFSVEGADPKVEEGLQIIDTRSYGGGNRVDNTTKPDGSFYKDVGFYKCKIDSNILPLTEVEVVDLNTMETTVDPAYKRKKKILLTIRDSVSSSEDTFTPSAILHLRSILQPIKDSFNILARCAYEMTPREFRIMLQGAVHHLNTTATKIDPDTGEIQECSARERKNLISGLLSHLAEQMSSWVESLTLVEDLANSEYGRDPVQLVRHTINTIHSMLDWAYGERALLHLISTVRKLDAAAAEIIWSTSLEQAHLQLAAKNERCGGAKARINIVDLVTLEPLFDNIATFTMGSDAAFYIYVDKEIRDSYNDLTLPFHWTTSHGKWEPMEEGNAERVAMALIKKIDKDIARTTEKTRKIITALKADSEAKASVLTKNNSKKTQSDRETPTTLKERPYGPVIKKLESHCRILETTWNNLNMKKSSGNLVRDVAKVVLSHGRKLIQNSASEYFDSVEGTIGMLGFNLEIGTNRYNQVVVKRVTDSSQRITRSINSKWRPNLKVSEAAKEGVKVLAQMFSPAGWQRYIFLLVMQLQTFRSNKPDVGIVIYGPGGSGKSTGIEIMSAFSKDELKYMQPEFLTTSKNSATSHDSGGASELVKGSPIVVISEPPPVRLKSNIFKKIISSDRETARRANSKDVITFKIKSLVHIVSNMFITLDNSQSDTQSIDRRIVTLISDNKVVNDLSEISILDSTMNDVAKYLNVIAPDQMAPKDIRKEPGVSDCMFDAMISAQCWYTAHNLTTKWPSEPLKAIGHMFPVVVKDTVRGKIYRSPHINFLVTSLLAHKTASMSNFSYDNVPEIKKVQLCKRCTNAPSPDCPFHKPATINPLWEQFQKARITDLGAATYATFPEATCEFVSQGVADQGMLHDVFKVWCKIKYPSGVLSDDAINIEFERLNAILKSLGLGTTGVIYTGTKDAALLKDYVRQIPGVMPFWSHTAFAKYAILCYEDEELSDTIDPSKFYDCARQWQENLIYTDLDAQNKERNEENRKKNNTNILNWVDVTSKPIVEEEAPDILNDIAMDDILNCLEKP